MSSDPYPREVYTSCGVYTYAAPQQYLICTLKLHLSAPLGCTSNAPQFSHGAPHWHLCTELICWVHIRGGSRGGSRGSSDPPPPPPPPPPPWLMGHFAPPHHLWTNIKTNCFSCLGRYLQLQFICFPRP